MKDCMIDLETLGSPPDGAIVSLGAVQFDPNVRGAIGERWYEAIESVVQIRRYDRTMDPYMVEWWIKQSEEVRAAAFPSIPGPDLGIALRGFALWFKSLKLQRIWAWPPTFDIVLLDSAYTAVGVKRPWHRRGERDARTVVTMLGNPSGPRPKFPIESGSGLPRHHALADAWAQARLVQEALAHVAMTCPECSKMVGEVVWLNHK